MRNLPITRLALGDIISECNKLYKKQNDEYKTFRIKLTVNTLVFTKLIAITGQANFVSNSMQIQCTYIFF